MFRLITLVKNTRETPTGFAERLSGKIQSLGGPNLAYVYRCRDVTEEDLRSLVGYLIRTGSDPHVQWLRVELEGVTETYEFWLGWDEGIVTQMMERVLEDQGDLGPDPSPFH